jgi:hypothetical protein
MDSQLISLKRFKTVNALNFSEIAALQLFIPADRICIQVIIQPSKLTNPLTPPLCIGTVNFEPIEWLLEPFVRETVVNILETARARLPRPNDTRYARFAVAFSTAGHLVRLAKDE